MSLRTLQRLEAGQAVKTDVLLKLLNRLERLDAVEADAAFLLASSTSPQIILGEAGGPKGSENPPSGLTSPASHVSNHYLSPGRSLAADGRLF